MKFIPSSITIVTFVSKVFLPFKNNSFSPFLYHVLIFQNTFSLNIFSVKMYVGFLTYL